MRGGPCAIVGCDQPSLNLGWCSRHYQRWYKHGDPLGGKASPVPVAEQEAFLRALVAGEWPEECVKWPYSRTAKGYGVTTLDGVRIAAHRACCKIAHGEPPTPEHHAAHSCGLGHMGCINPGHLRWRTPKMNCAEARMHGSVPLGEQNTACVLTEVQVLEIYGLRHSLRHAEIAEKFGISTPTVSDICRGKTWAWLTFAERRRGMTRGTKHFASKLTEDQARAIKFAPPSVTNSELAAQYGVTTTTVGYIRRGKVWKWLERDEAAA